MKFFSIFFSLTLFLSSQFLSAQNTDTDARFLQIRKTYSLSTDGQVSQRIYKECKLYTHNAFHRLYGETFIVYNPDWQTLKIHTCYTLMADGKKIITPKNAFNEVLPRFAANAPAFNHLREMVVTHTGLEVGATIVLDYEIISRKDFFPYLMGQEVLAENVPVDRYELVMRVPETTPFNFRLYNLSQEPSVVRTGQEKSYTWKFQNLPSMMPEPFLPAETRYLPVLRYTTFPAMQQAAQYLTGQEAFRAPVPPALIPALDRIREEEKPELLKVLSLQEMVINDFQLYQVPPALNGYRLRTPLQVVQEAGGTAVEKALLLAVMLRQIGAEARVAAVQDAYYDKGIGEFGNFSQYLVECKAKGEKPILLSVLHADDQNPVYRLGGKSLIYLNADNSFSAETLKPASAETTLDAELRLSKEGTLTGTAKLSVKNADNPFFQLNRDNTHATKLIKALPVKAELNGNPQLDPATSRVVLTLQAGDKLKKAGPFLTFEIPWLSGGLYAQPMSDLPSVRKHPVDISVPHTEEINLNLDLPPGFQMSGNPVRYSVKNQAGKLDIDIRQEGSQLLIRKSISLETSVLTPDFYSQLRELTSIWYSKPVREVLISSGK